MTYNQGAKTPYPPPTLQFSSGIFTRVYGNGSDCTLRLCKHSPYQILKDESPDSAPLETELGEVLPGNRRADPASDAQEGERFPGHMPSPERDVAD
jgi:hypothetical protein